NTQTCPVCLGMPGSLPVMNKKAYFLGMKTALALNCRIPTFTKWDRKNYFYPDLPKGYQTSQFDLPMSEEGYLDIKSTKDEFEPCRIRIIRAHLEEDAGKSLHDEAAGKGDSRIDLNRTGTPLLEIVSYPDMRSAAEAKSYLQELRLLLTYLDVSDCNMQEGSLRCDANVNLHIPVGDDTIATPIVEIKNMNSFRSVERGIAYEARRQYDVWQETGKVLGELPKQTRGWDDAAQVTRSQREKEESADYRYFPCPDLVPVVVTDQQIEEVRREICELPAALRERLESEFGLTTYTAEVIVNQGRALVNYFLELADASGDHKLAGNWVQGEVLRILNDQEISIEEFKLSATQLAEMLKLIQSGDLDSSKAKDVFAVMLDSGKSAAEIIEELGIEKVDEDDLEDLCRLLVERNQRVVDDVKSGNEKAVGALIGQAKKENPNVNPGQVRQICLELIKNM
ncbi:MAG: Asp-tRNA(Asn)/Glu-tRNA(Gln) amidotransferase subunit GatB, partial [Planctomycetota bacterium]|nr:Asp-tRNA(Asn)/Glu-tRNA(Gln) amidotransferase subunit GatB [Planctomycetota bacterium]